MRLISFQFFLTIILFLYYNVFANINNNNNQDRVMTRFVIDAIKANGISPNPSTVAAFLCFEKDELIFLTKYSSFNQILFTVKNPIQGFDNDVFSKDYNLHNSYYVLDVDCPGAIDILLKANSTSMFTGPIKWLFLEDVREKKEGLLNNEKTYFDLYKNLQLLPDSDIVIGQRMNTDLIKLISIYKTSIFSELIIENRGYWYDGKGISSMSTQVSSVRRKDLRRTALKSCLVMTDPDTINHLTDFYGSHIDPITKVNYHWVNFLVESMNATVNFSSVNSWGYRNPNGSWNGMIGLLDRKEIDIGGTALFFTTERTHVIEYVSLYTPTREVFIFRRPPLSYVSNIFVLPFRPTVWLATGIFLILVASLSHIGWKWEWYTARKEEKDEKFLRVRDTVRLSWSDNILMIIGAVSQQGSTFVPRRVSLRIIFLMLFVALLSLYTSYTANIVALLQSSTRSINTLETLLHSSLKIGVDDKVYNRHYIQGFQDPIRKAIYEQKIAPRGEAAWMNIEEGVGKLRKGLFAFHAECGPVYKLIQETFQEEEKCGLEEIDYLDVIDPLLAIQKRSPYREIIKVGVLKIHESGLQTRHIKRLYTSKPICHGHTSFVSVGLIDCYAAFATLGWGMIISLIVLFAEVIWDRQNVLHI